MAAEIWDLYDARGERTGRTMLRGQEVPTGFYHIGVHIWPVNPRGEFLIQRRALTVQWKPGVWAVTGGSAISGELPLAAARRELREELGYDAAQAEMHLVACFRRTNAFCHVYMIGIDRLPQDFVLQAEEVSAVRWCSRDGIQCMLDEGKLYNYGDSYFRTLFEYQRTYMRL